MLSTPTCGLALFRDIHVPHFTLEHMKNKNQKLPHHYVSKLFVNTPNTQAFDEHQIQGNLAVLETHPVNTLFHSLKKTCCDSREVSRRKCHVELLDARSSSTRYPNSLQCYSPVQHRAQKHVGMTTRCVTPEIVMSSFLAQRSNSTRYQALFNATTTNNDAYHTMYTSTVSTWMESTLTVEFSGSENDVLISLRG